MAVTPERKPALSPQPVGDDADELRALVGAMLGGSYREDFYLWDVASLCRSKPDFARHLLTLIDRYQSLGQMSAAQHQRIRQTIEQSQARREVWPPSDPATRSEAQRADRPRAAAAAAAASTTSSVVAADAPVWADRTVTAPLPAAADPVPASLQSSARKPPRQVSARQAAQRPGPPPAPHRPAPQPQAQAQAPSRTTAPPEAPRQQPTQAAPAAARTPAPAAIPVGPSASGAAVSAGATPSAATPSAAIPSVTAPGVTPQGITALKVAPVTAVRAPATESGAVNERVADDAVKGTAAIGVGSVLRKRYELQNLLGCGGMASVYSAVDRYRASLGLEDCHVALKLVTTRPGQPDGVGALGREFHHAQLLSHPNVVNVYEIDHEGNASFYTMELLAGERLSQLSERIGGPLPQRYSLAIIRDIGAAIAHAHSRGVVHADLKPHNIFVTFGGQVRVLDFGGLSPSLEDPWSPAEPVVDRPPRFRAATPAYASCEQLQGLRAEPRDDTYALACIAYELLAGRHPFGGKSSLEARAQRLRPRRPRGLPGRSWRALRQGLAWERAQRPHQLGPWLQQLGVVGAVHHLPPSHQLRSIVPPRSWPQPLAAAVVVLGCLGAVAFSMSRQGGLQWHRTLAAAQATLQGARRELQATPAATPQTPAPQGAPLSPSAALAAPAPSSAAGATADANPLTRATGASSHTARRRSRRARLADAAGTPGAAITRADNTAGATAVAPAAAPSPGIALDSPAATALSAGGGVSTAGDASSDTSAAGVTFAAASYAVDNDAPAARLIVRRTGSARDDLRFVWWTVEDSAKADVDFAPLGRRVERIPRGEDNVTIYVPIISNPLRHHTATFYVALGSPDAAEADLPSARASVTIERGG